ncbi:MAG: argininosuccinate lyase [Chloroflexi bacterium]|nr:argininosuccinate lyase [Chloroflexota bacterium]
MDVKPLRSRFHKDADEQVLKYTASIPFDQRLYREDIAGSMAHAKMLAKQGIISDKEAEIIMMGLVSIREEIERGEFEFKIELEDIHMSIEARLTEKVGAVAGKLHTARSRNDQVVLDMRLFTKEAIRETLRGLSDLQTSLLDVAEANRSVMMPGYTHLQRAQPVLLAHHLLAYFEMLERDVSRFRDCMERTDVMPLGSGALAGVPYPIDRLFVARELGFSRVSQNSLDAVSDRDFVIEYQAAAAISMMHLSRLAEELTLWSSAEFGFVEIDDAYATGSSIMPQKRNPDVAELARGKTGRTYGHLMGMLTVMKGLPLSYNRDMQEDKEGLFDTVDTVLSTVEVFAGMLKTLKIDASRTRQAVEESYSLATDIADYLTKKGVPFREAYTVVARLIAYAADQHKGLPQIDLSEYRRFSPLFAEDVFSVTAEAALSGRNCLGGTAPQQVEAQLARARKIVQDASGA